MKIRFLALLLVFAVLFGLTACGAAGDPVRQDPSAARTFTDDAGREVELPAEITRIVPSGALAQIVLLAIAPEMLVGLASRIPDSADGILSDQVMKQPYLGSLSAGADLNVEELALAAPQLILDIGEPKSSVKEDLDALQRQTQIPAVYLSATLETMPDTFRRLGELLGKEERGEELAQFCKKVYTRTLSIMEQVGDDKVSCLYVLGAEGLNVIAASSYHAELLDLLTDNLAVVDNPLGKGTGNEVTMEQISLWNPDFVIFAPGSIYSTARETETWNQITAIVSGNYVEVPEAPYNWMGMPPSAQRYLGLIWLTAELYPDYCDYDVRAEIMEYYELFYGCTLTDGQYDAITANAFRR